MAAAHFFFIKKGSPPRGVEVFDVAIRAIEGASNPRRRIHRQELDGDRLAQISRRASGLL